MNTLLVTVAGSPHPSLGVGAGGRRLFGLSKAAQAALEPQASAPKAGRSKKKRTFSFPRWGKAGMGAFPASCPIHPPGQYAK
jgi:hypothetical protein